MQTSNNNYTPFQLSAELVDHTDQVRTICAQPHNRLITGSLDTTLKVWQSPADNNDDVNDEKSKKRYRCMDTLNGHNYFVSDVKFDAKSSNIISVSHDKSIIIWNMIKKHDSSSRDDDDAGDCDYIPVIQLQNAHESSITCIEILHFLNEGSGNDEHFYFATGSWDKTIKIWSFNKSKSVLQCIQTLKGHTMNVLALLCLRNTSTPLLISGCGDGSIKFWSCTVSPTIQFAETKHFMASTTCVRGFAQIVRGNSVEFLSVANDGILKFWNLNAVNTGEVMAHNNLTYSVSVSEREQLIYTSSEDKTVKIWSFDGQLLQTIEHGACIWKAIPLENGDLATACADCTARVFTRNVQRVAHETVIEQFHKNIQNLKLKKSSGGGAGGVGGAGVDVSTLPNSSILQRPGSKNGEVKMVNNNGSPEVWSWNGTEFKWEKMGDIVDGPSVGSGFSDKAYFEGKAYDYVFDIELEQPGSGTRTFKLPFNRIMNPYEAAQDFIWKHELPQYYLDQIAKFVIKNSDQGGSGPTAAVEESEWEKEQKRLQQVEQERSLQRDVKHFPKSNYVAFDQANTDGIVRKVKEFNELFKGQNAGADVVMNDQELELFNQLISAIKSKNFVSINQSHLQLVNDKLLKWPIQQLFPVMDLMRLVILTPIGSQYYASRAQATGIDVLSQLFDVMKVAGPSNNVLNMLFMRFAANVFVRNESIGVAHYSQLVMLVKSFSKTPNDKSIQTSATTLVSNLCAVKNADVLQQSGELLLATISEMLSVIVDHALVYNLLVAAGTLLTNCPALLQRATAYNIPQWAQQFTASPTPQVHGVAFRLKQLF